MIGSLDRALRYSLDRSAEADRLECAIAAALERGHRTADLARPGEASISTAEMGDAVVAALDAAA